MLSKFSVLKAFVFKHYYWGNIMIRLGIVLGLAVISAVSAFASQERDRVEGISTAPSEGTSKSALVFSIRPEMGFVNPQALNDSTSNLNSQLRGSGMSGVDIPQLNNTLQADFFLGYALNEDLDVGAFFSLPPLTTKTVAGKSATGNAISRTAGVRATLLGVQAHYTFIRKGGLYFYGSPAMGLGNFTVTDKLDAGVASYDLVMEGKKFALKGALGAAYQFNPYFSLHGEGGYMFWESGSLTHKNSSAVLNVKEGESVKGTAGDLVTDLSGPFVGVGFTIHYGI